MYFYTSIRSTPWYHLETTSLPKEIHVLKERKYRPANSTALPYLNVYYPPSATEYRPPSISAPPHPTPLTLPSPPPSSPTHPSAPSPLRPSCSATSTHPHHHSQPPA